VGLWRGSACGGLDATSRGLVDVDAGVRAWGLILACNGSRDASQYANTKMVEAAHAQVSVSGHV